MKQQPHRKKVTSGSTRRPIFGLTSLPAISTSIIYRLTIAKPAYIQCSRLRFGSGGKPYLVVACPATATALATLPPPRARMVPVTAGSSVNAQVRRNHQTIGRPTLSLMAGPMLHAKSTSVTTARGVGMSRPNGVESCQL